MYTCICVHVFSCFLIKLSSVFTELSCLYLEWVLLPFKEFFIGKLMNQEHTCFPVFLHWQTYTGNQHIFMRLFFKELRGKTSPLKWTVGKKLSKRDHFLTPKTSWSFIYGVLPPKKVKYYSFHKHQWNQRSEGCQKCSTPEQLTHSFTSFNTIAVSGSFSWAAVLESGCGLCRKTWLSAYL